MLDITSPGSVINEVLLMETSARSRHSFIIYNRCMDEASYDVGSPYNTQLLPVRMGLLTGSFSFDERSSIIVDCRTSNSSRHGHTYGHRVCHSLSDYSVDSGLSTPVS